MNGKFAGYLQQRKTYVKLIVGFTLISAVIIFLLSAIFRNMYSVALYDQVTASDQDNLARMAAELQKLAEEIDYVHISVLSNPRVDSFIYQNALNPLDEYNVKKEFVRFKNIHSKVHSMYLYNGKIDYFITTESVGKPYAEFFDSGVLALGEGRRALVSRELPGAEPPDSPRRVLSFIYSAFRPDGRGVERSIVINVFDVAELGLLGDGAGAETLLLDSGGRLVSRSLAEASSQGLLAGEGWERIRAAPEARGSFTLAGAGGRQDYVVSYAKLELNGWVLANIQGYGQITAYIRERTDRILYVALGMLLLSGVFVFFLSRNIYTPIDLLVKRVGKLGKLSHPASRKALKNELDYIMDGFTQVMEQASLMRKNQEEKISELKEGFLRRALTESVSEELLQEKAEEYSLAVEPNGLCVLVAQIDELGAIKPEHRYIYGATVRQIIQDAFLGQQNAESVLLDGVSTALILNLPDGPLPEAVRDILFEIKGAVYQTLGRSLTIGLGCHAETLRDLRQSYDRAAGMADNRFVLGYGQIIGDELVKGSLKAGGQIEPELETALLEAIRMNREEAYAAAADRLIEAMSLHESGSARMLLAHMLLTCARAMNGIIGDSADPVNPVTPSPRPRAYGGLPESAETIGQAREWFAALFAQYRQAVEQMNLQKNSKKMQKIVSEATAHIRKNYGDPDLTIDTFAARYGYTAKYFARMFKDVAGAFINDYIRKFRIDKAKTLLERTNLSVSEIAELVGYANKNYFFYSFKKETGMTPLSYRGANYHS
jgi:AraC-like DNA-binding protein